MKHAKLTRMMDDYLQLAADLGRLGEADLAAVQALLASLSNLEYLLSMRLADERIARKDDELRAMGCRP